MPEALSPKKPAPRLVSTHVVDGTAPRKTQTVYQAVALARGYTIKAGASTRMRLRKGVPAYKTESLPTSDLPNAGSASIVEDNPKNTTKD
ncbi:MAG TPA: hypothetical protein VLN58_02095 [Verrucomicrobiae bacterium]|nr:hypothetical protein [Verrucomicrobiae bacterium]